MKKAVEFYKRLCINSVLTVDEFIQKEDIDSPLLNVSSHYKKQGKSKIEYIDEFGTYDSEVYTVVLSKALNEKTGKYEAKDAKGLLYIWQVCLFGKYVIFGHYLNEFVKLVRFLNDRYMLHRKRRLVIYIHNAEYDLSFLYGYFPDMDVFATDSRSPLYARVGGIEFRCSYRLTQLSLAAFASSEGVSFLHRKQSGDDFDYKRVRTPDDPGLSLNDLYYCYCDVVGLYEALKLKMQHEENNLATIPFTATGYPRRDMRAALRENPDNRKLFEKCAMTPHIYKLLRDSFRGGNTHANRHKSGMIIEEPVCSYDIASSYPYIMCTYDNFPLEAYHKYEVEDIDDLLDILPGHSVLIDITFHNLKTDAVIPYIPIDKCKELDWMYAAKDRMHFAEMDNGRVLSSSKARMVIFGEELLLIAHQYDIKSFTINECYIAKSGKMPLEFRKTVSKYFIKKSELKHSEAGSMDEYLYNMVFKPRVNGCYGMCVQDPVTIPVEWNFDGVVDEEGNVHHWIQHEVDVAGQLESFNKSLNSFLVYAHGCIIAMAARLRLQEAIDICGDALVYVDTDSVKFIYSKAICDELDAINDRIEKQVAAEDVNCIGYSKKGKKQILGVWDNEGCTDKHGFITYGAKKYATVKHGYFEVTIAGLNKKLGAAEFGSIDNVILGVTIENSGRTRSIYDDDVNPHYVNVNGKDYEIRTNIAIVDSTYTLGVTHEYSVLCENIIEK